MRSPLRMPPMAVPAVVAGLVTLGAVAACGSAPADPAAPTAAQVSQQSMQDMPGMAGMSGMEGMDGPALWAVQSGPLGVITTDDAGHMLYRYDGDSAAPSTSACTGACATTWVPVEVKDGKEPDLMGIDQAKVGQFTRPDGGVQLTLAGWPLYYNTGDKAGLADAGHNGADGKWFAISPTGAKVQG